MEQIIKSSFFTFVMFLELHIKYVLNVGINIKKTFEEKQLIFFASLKKKKYKFAYLNEWLVVKIIDIT